MRNIHKSVFTDTDGCILHIANVASFTKSHINWATFQKPHALKAILQRWITWCKEKSTWTTEQVIWSVGSSFTLFSI